MISCRSLNLFCRATNRLGKRRSSIIPGRATPAGTKAFVSRSKSLLYHRFELSQLYINPVIHGPPVAGTMTKDEADQCLAQALLHNKSNGLFVYHHSSRGPWAARALCETLLMGKLSRSEVVAFAGIGKVSEASQILTRLKEAATLTGLEHLDMAIVEFDDASFERDPLCLDAAIEVLEGACRQSLLTCYGMKVDVAPYRYHTPSPRLKNSLAMVPPILEDLMRSESAPHADLVIYNISPTTALPASYPMLDPEDLDLADLEARASRTQASQAPQAPREGGLSLDSLEEGEVHDDYVSHTRGEGERSYSRISWDPLLCRQGEGKEGDNSNDYRDGNDNSDEHELSSLVEELEALDKALTSSGTSNDSALTENSMDKEATGSSPGGDALGSTSSPEDQQAGQDVANEPRNDGIPLVSGLLPPQLEQKLSAALDDLCPELGSTPELQIKALRAVMSVGIDAVVVDAELSACLGQMELRPGHLLPSSATEDVFGTFQIPSELVRPH